MSPPAVPTKKRLHFGKPTGETRMVTEVLGYYPKAHQAIFQMFERRLRAAGPVDTDTAAGIILPAIDAAMREIRAIRCD